MSESTRNNATRLTLSPSPDTANGAVILSVTKSLTVDTYSSTVTINACGTSAVTLPVTFTITAAAVLPAPPSQTYPVDL